VTASHHCCRCSKDRYDPAGLTSTANEVDQISATHIEYLDNSSPLARAGFRDNLCLTTAFAKSSVLDGVLACGCATCDVRRSRLLDRKFASRPIAAQERVRGVFIDA
jgi:hypothetical protein